MKVYKIELSINQAKDIIDLLGSLEAMGGVSSDDEDDSFNSECKKAGKIASKLSQTIKEIKNKK